jgi:hypothetical protein
VGTWLGSVVGVRLGAVVGTSEGAVVGASLHAHHHQQVVNEHGLVKPVQAAHALYHCKIFTYLGSLVGASVGSAVG